MEIKTYELEPDPRTVVSQNESDDVYISFEIGNGQIGGNIVKKQDKLLAKGKLTDPTFIGKMTDLRDGAVDVKTNVLDVNPSSNLCVVTTTFRNQENIVLYTKIDKGEAPADGIARFIGHYVFKSIVMLFFIFLTSSGTLFGQTDKLNFKSLEMPASPGLILLDNSPTAIERPTTPQGIGLNLLGFFGGNGGAFEIAPFWLTSHPKLTAEKMYKNKCPVLYNFSVSMASIMKDTVKYLSGGFRTRLLQVYGNRIPLLDSLKAAIEDALSEEVLDLKKIENLRKQYVEIIGKPVFNIDLAAAIGGSSVENSFSTLVLNRRAAWVTFNWRPKGDFFYVTGITRYIYNANFEKYVKNADLLDLGARLNYDINALTLSAEYLQRMNLTAGKKDDYRLAMAGSYKISENFFLTTTFGKNFTNVNNIIALLGVNVGFSKNEVRAF